MRVKMAGMGERGVRLAEGGKNDREVGERGGKKGGRNGMVVPKIVGGGASPLVHVYPLDKLLICSRFFLFAMLFPLFTPFHPTRVPKDQCVKYHSNKISIWCT